MSAHDDKLALIHGLADGELDAANTLAIEAHLKICPDCGAEMARIEAVRELLGQPGMRERAPAGLRERIEALLDAEPKTVRRRPPASAAAPGGGLALAGSFGAHVLNGRWASGALAGMIAATLLFVLAVPQLTYVGTENQLVQSHVRSLLVGHLVDVPTSNRHVVKPWFNGKVDFAPPVPDLVDEGFPLAGGRLDYIDDHEVAAIVYRRRLHVINLFVRPARALSLPLGVAAHRDGYSLLRWTSGGLEYWAVSDLDVPELKLFHQAYAAKTGS